MRIYTRHSVFYIGLPTFVKSPVNPSLPLRAPAVAADLMSALLLVILELSTDSSARLLYHEQCVRPWHSFTVQQTKSASFTDQKLRKENTIFKTIHLLTAETNVSMVLHLAVVLLKSDRGEKTLF